MYRALYRVWRPQRFDEIVGQQMITQTLKNAIMTHQTSHAYLLPVPGELGKRRQQRFLPRQLTVTILLMGNLAMNVRLVRRLPRGN